MGHAAMRLAQAHRSDDPGLSIGPARAADPGTGGHGGGAALCTHDKRGGQDPAVLQAHRGRARTEIDPGHARRCQHLYAFPLHRSGQGRPDPPVLDHVAQGLAL